ncbi:trypsin-like peptidase domain-containing protein [Staphylococcus delphini]|uniref:trypsin-like peptidase domain-containing protein n=1 Tax=Staphylococcus delphini TaxID=53344 RepID=UPI000BBCA1F0|nr:trypsin-like peptidase domain-containing protein [Staphylococcus delphini]PCF43881.1 serine protease [Staphylococcus delphini]
MKRKRKIIVYLCFFMSLLMMGNASAGVDPRPGTQQVVNTTTDPNGKLNARYDPDNSVYCSATLITPNTWLTARHCAGVQPQTGYIGQVYPGQSGWSTPFGMMIIRDFLPDSADDIAIIKGKDKDKTTAYKYYMRGLRTSTYEYDYEKLKSMIGQAIYSYGYPGDKGGFKQYLSTGVITRVNQHTNEISTTMPAFPGQSGSGVYLQNGHLLGVLYGNESNIGYRSAKIHPIDHRLKTWIDKNTE